jgi:hypothetical protein
MTVNALRMLLGTLLDLTIKVHTRNKLNTYEIRLLSVGYAVKVAGWMTLGLLTTTIPAIRQVH